MISRKRTYSGEEARGGEIVLRRRWERIVFFGGLGASVFLALIGALFWR